MKKALKKQAAFVMLSAALAVQTGFPGYAATSVMGSWANEDGGWKDGNRMAEDRQFLVLF